MVLPLNEKLSIQALSRVFSDTSESYKIFWFSGVLDVVKSGRAIATFDEIINHMIQSVQFFEEILCIYGFEQIAGSPAPQMNQASLCRL